MGKSKTLHRCQNETKSSKTSEDKGSSKAKQALLYIGLKNKTT